MVVKLGYEFQCNFDIQSKLKNGNLHYSVRINPEIHLRLLAGSLCAECRKQSYGF